MNRILFLRCGRACPGAPPGPKFDVSMGIMSALLRDRGHQTRLLQVSSFDEPTLHAEFEAFDPQVVYLHISGTAVDLARRVLGSFGEPRRFSVIAGGAFATLMPSTALSMPGVNGVVVGEPDIAFPAFADQVRAGGSLPEAAGVRLRRADRVVQFRPAALIEDLDALPFADRALFGLDEATSEFEIVTSRGCPLSCAYCVNEGVRSLYDDAPNFVRRRSPENICDEIDQICLDYPQTERLWFSDHAFALDYEWLKQFALVYEDRCGLPFSCHIRANRCDEATAELLARAGCDLVEVELISGNDFVRNEILCMETSLRQIDRTFGLFRDRDIRTRAINYIGVPYSNRLTENDTIRLNRRLKPDEIVAHVYYPYWGTRARGIAQEQGWLSNRSESAHGEGKTVLDMPNLPARTVVRLARRMPEEVVSPGKSGIWRAIGGLKVARGKTLADLVARLRGNRVKAPLLPQRRP